MQHSLFITVREFPLFDEVHKENKRIASDIGWGDCRGLANANTRTEQGWDDRFNGSLS